MSATYQDYSALISDFYHKLIKTHKNKYQLLQKFTRMTNQISRSSLSYVKSNKKSWEDSNSISGRSKSTSYRTIKQVILKSVQASYLYINASFKKVFAFAYLYSLIDKQNTQVFNMIETKVKLFMNTIQKLPQQDKTSSQWKKITQLLNNKDKVRWEKILGDSINRFSENFIDVIVKSILSISPNADGQIEPNKAWLKKISSQLKYTLVYLEYENKQLVNKIQEGHYQQRLILAYLKSDQQYAHFDKIPNQDPQTNTQSKHEKDKSPVQGQKNKFFLSVYEKKHKFREQISNKSVSSRSIKGKSEQKVSILKTNSRLMNQIRKKTHKIVQSIIKEYQIGTQKISSLEVLNQTDSKQARIRRILQNRKKKEQQ